MATPKKRILIVEDNVDLAEMMSAYFRVQDYEVVQATWGEDAVRLAVEKLPALILLDIRLPDIDGYEVCRQLRQSHRTRTIPVIFLTEKREREDKLAGLELGAVDYITKPFDIKELDLRMRSALRRAQITTRDNPVTGLSEGVLVEEKLAQMLNQTEWGLVLAGLNGIDRFRDRYGFVAADDVIRAVSVMLKHAMEETGASADFLGHVDAATFLIISAASRAPKLADSCLLRLTTAIPYFYPAAADRSAPDPSDSSPLAPNVRCLTARDGQFGSLADLQAALAR